MFGKIASGANASRMLTFATVACVIVGGASFGSVLDGLVGTLIGATAAGVGLVFGWSSFSGQNESTAILSGTIVSLDDKIALTGDLLILGVALYAAAMFPAVPGGVSVGEKKARRTVAYRLAARDGLPHSVRLSAAHALGIIDDGLDKEGARAALKELSVMIYGCRSR